MISFYLYILFMRSSGQEYWSGLPFPSPVDHVLLELFIMTHPSWVSLHGMAHSLIELDKAVIHERVSVVTIDIIITLNIKANWMKKYDQVMQLVGKSLQVQQCR